MKQSNKRTPQQVKAGAARPPLDIPLPSYVGERLRLRRDRLGLRQEEIATAARRWGFEWTQATVAALETGRRQLSGEELLFIPWIANGQGFDAGGRAHGAPVELSDLLGEDARMIQVTPRVALTARGVQAILSGRARDAGLKGAHFRVDFKAWARDESTTGTGALELESVRRHFGTLTWVDLAAAAADQHGNAERKAAQRLQTFPLAVAAAARKRWGGSFTQERDRRVAEQHAPGVAPARLQALRGHVARALIEELRQDGIEGWKPPRQMGRRRRRGA